MNPKLRWRIHAVTILLPFAAPVVAGFYWLWTNQMLLWWVSASALLGLGWWLICKLIDKYRRDPEWLDISDAIVWTDNSRVAWKKIEAISAARRNANPEIGSPDFYLQTLNQVMQAVAEAYYPRQKQAILEVKLPYLLKVIEMLAQELRIAFSENVPGSHVFSINDVVKGRKMAVKGRDIYRLFRILTAGMDPVSAIIREFKILTAVDVLYDSTDELKRWLIDAYIKKIGYYAIELYSGNITLDDTAIGKPTQQARQEFSEIKRREQSLNAEPFRVLVAGQTNAGKSSLINAIAGDKLAITDVTPNPHTHQSYFFQLSDLAPGVVVNSRRYSEEHVQKSRLSVSKLAAESDVLIMVLSAANPAYQIDKLILDSIKQLPAAPSIIIALTHIDKLRPLREWNPPYDLIKPCTPKAETINKAMTGLAEQLNIGFDQIIPVSLREDHIYNCQERLLPVLLQQLASAERKRCLRGAQFYEREKYWPKLWRQSFNAGSLVTKTGIEKFTKF